MKVSIGVTQEDDNGSPITTMLFNRNNIEPYMVFVNPNTPFRLTYEVVNDEQETFHVSIKHIITSADDFRLETPEDVETFIEPNINVVNTTPIDLNIPILNNDTPRQVIIKTIFQKHSLSGVIEEQIELEYIVGVSASYKILPIPEDANYVITLDAITTPFASQTNGLLNYNQADLDNLINTLGSLLGINVLGSYIIDLTEFKKQIYIFSDREISVESIVNALYTKIIISNGSNYNTNIFSFPTITIPIAIVVAFIAILGIAIIWYAIDKLNTDRTIQETITKRTENVAAIVSDTTKQIKDIKAMIDEGIIDQSTGEQLINDIITAQNEGLYSLAITPAPESNIIKDIKDLLVTGALVGAGLIAAYTVLKIVPKK